MLNLAESVMSTGFNVVLVGPSPMHLTPVKFAKLVSNVARLMVLQLLGMYSSTNVGGVKELFASSSEFVVSSI